MGSPVRPPDTRGCVRFGDFEVDLRTGELRRRGFKVKLQGKPLQVLITLLDHPGELVTREELRRNLWSHEKNGSFDRSVNIAVYKLRAALNDLADSPRFIETLPRRGYRFIAPVSRSCPPEATALRQKADPTRRIGSAPGVPSRGSTPVPFNGGITEKVVSQIRLLYPQHLGAMTRSPGMQNKPVHTRARDLSQQLSGDYFFAGSLRFEGDRVRINAELVRPGVQSNHPAAMLAHGRRKVVPIQSPIAERGAKPLRRRQAG